MNNPKDVAYFFAKYASDSTPITAADNNLVISTLNEDNGGRNLLDDILSHSGEDGYLSVYEMQKWAKEIGFTGDILEVMIVIGKMDDWLCGSNTLNYDVLRSEDKLYDDYPPLDYDDSSCEPVAPSSVNNGSDKNDATMDENTDNVAIDDNSEEPPVDENDSNGSWLGNIFNKIKEFLF